MSGQFKLLRSKRFAPLFITQFLGAFNDNLLKNALVVLLTFHTAQWSNLSTALLVNLAAGLFILPFFLFSATAGQLADKYDKARLARFTKFLEVLIMLVALWGFMEQSLSLLLAALFLLGLQSTLFGPIKYALLPQHLKPGELLGGNALIEAGTFASILLGTLFGGLLAGWLTQPAWIAGAGIVVALAGLVSSLKIPTAPAPVPDLRLQLNPVPATLQTLRFARQDRTVFQSILGISWFWLYGALFLTQLPAFTEQVLGGNESMVTLLLAVFTLGIGTGSLLCERLTSRLVEIGLVPLGSIGLTIVGIDLFFAVPPLPADNPGLGFLLSQWSTWRIMLDLLLTGLFGGFFIVPLYALIQLRTEEDKRARLIAANNIINALFMVIGAVLAGIALSAGLSIPTLFLLATFCNTAVAIYIYSLVPEFLIRFVAWLLVKTLYRLRVQGTDHIPQEGAALIVANHVSFADAVILMGSTPRPIRFVMDHRIFKTPLLGFIFRHSGAIPIAPAKEDPELLERAFERIDQVLANGELVGIFPEGAITRDGEMQPFRPGVTRILNARPVPVIPMGLSGLWGSFFSRIEGKAMCKPFRRGLFSRVSLKVGAPVAPQDATPKFLFEQVRELRGDTR